MEVKIDIEVAKSGVNTVKVNQFYLHSKFDPIKESENLIKKKFKPDCTNIIFGYGLGYLVDEILTQRKNNEKIYIIDSIFTQKYERHKDEDFILIDSSDTTRLIKILRGIKVEENINLITSPNYDKVCLDEYSQFLKVLKNIITNNKVTENTLRFFAKQWQKNYIFNLKNIQLDNSLLELEKKYDSPIVIASGGPSLTKQLPLLKKYRQNMLLIAAGSTINTLLINGITPDYVVSIDGGEANYNHFKNLNLSETLLIYNMDNHHKIPDSFTKKGYYFLQAGKGELGNHISKVKDEKICLIPGGASVANSAFSIAHYISTGPIAIIGQDLAITNNKTHAEGNKHTKVVNDVELDTKYIKETGYYGEEVYTTNVFKKMRDDFNDLRTNFKEILNDDREVFNSTEGGILINEIPNLSFKVFCESYLTKSVRIVKTNNKDTSHINLDKLLTFIKDESLVYTELEKSITMNLNLIKKGKLNFSNKILKKLDKIDKNIYSLFKETPAEITLNKIHLETLKYFNEKKGETYKEKEQRITNQNEFLYTELYELVKDLESNYLLLKEEIEGELNERTNL